MTFFICPPAPRKTLSSDTVLAVGFGMVVAKRDGDVVWTGDDEDKTVADIDAMAMTMEGDWTIEFHGPLSGSTYHLESNEWVLVASNRGFA